MLAQSGSATPRGPWPSGGRDLQDARSGRCTRSPRNSYKLGGEGPGPVLSPGAPADTSAAGGEAGAGRAEQLCTAATCATTWAEGALPGARGAADSRRREAAGAVGQRTRRASAGEQGVKRGRRQRACQTRACAVCTASVLWVSAAAAAAAGGSLRPGHRRLQPPGPRAATAGAATQCGTRCGAGGPAAWGRHGRQLDAGGAAAPGVGAGSRRRRRAPRVPAREEERERVGKTALLAAPAPGRRPALPCPCPQPRPRTGRCPQCRRRGLFAARRGGRAGRAAPSAGGPGMVW